MWGHLHPHLPLRGGPRAADQGSAVFAVESLGHALGEADRRQEGAHRGRPQDCRHSALHLDRRYRVLVDSREGGLTRDPPPNSAPAEALSLPGRRVRTTAQRLWVDLGMCVRSDRFTPRGVTPLTPIMGRATDPGENHDPGKARFTRSLTRAPQLENSL